MHVLRLDVHVTGYTLSWDLVQEFPNAYLKEDDRFKRRVTKVGPLENKQKP
jgi:hypothetical protein